MGLPCATLAKLMTGAKLSGLFISLSVTYSPFLTLNGKKIHRRKCIKMLYLHRYNILQRGDFDSGLCFGVDCPSVLENTHKHTETAENCGDKTTKYAGIESL